MQAEAERQRQERKKIETARRRNLAVGLAALALLVFAFYQTRAAQHAEEMARIMTKFAEKNKAVAEQALAEAKIAQDQVEGTLADLRQLTTTADRAFVLARQATDDVVLALLENAKTSVYHLRYNEARATLLKAAGLGQRAPEVARALLEIAFFDHETGQTMRADSLADAIGGLLDMHPDLTTFKKLSNLPLLQPVMKALQARYYGDMADVPGGTYDMGETYRVILSPYRLSTTETTIWQYNLYCTAKRRHVSERVYADGTVKKVGDLSWGWEQGDFPVVYVNWYDAVDYCNWASEQRGFQPAYRIEPALKDTNNLDMDNGDKYKWTVTLLPKSNGYRLPTEAEWQYAATSAGRDATGYADSNKMDEVGWYYDNSGDRPHTVKTKKSNGLGLYDMGGNVGEWCLDWYDYYPSEMRINPTGPEKGSHRVFCGGSWLTPNRGWLSKSRKDWLPDDRDSFVGFRLALAP